MHLSQSLLKNGENVFYDPQGDNQLSEVAMFYLAGLIRHAPAITAIVNPTVNSYKRLVSGFEAPVYIAWSSRNRSPLIRIPAKRGPSTRLEFRSPDPTSNPYLALAVCAKAGISGIKQKIVPPPPCDQNIYQMTAAERAKMGIENLPASLEDALQKLARDEVIRVGLGEHIFQRFIEAKQIEWNQYRMQVHPWEIQEYLTKF
jgi:glutamine synthetase